MLFSIQQSYIDIFIFSIFSENIIFSFTLSSSRHQAYSQTIHKWQ